MASAGRGEARRGEATHGSVSRHDTETSRLFVFFGPVRLGAASHVQAWRGAAGRGRARQHMGPLVDMTLKLVDCFSAMSRAKQRALVHTAKRSQISRVTKDTVTDGRSRDIQGEVTRQGTDHAA